MGDYTLAPHLAALVENANGGFRMSQAMRDQLAEYVKASEPKEQSE